MQTTQKEGMEMTQTRPMTFLTYGQLDALIASGVRVTLAESGRVLVVWSSAHHGSMYAWNNLAQSFQFVRGAFKS